MAAGNDRTCGRPPVGGESVIVEEPAATMRGAQARSRSRPFCEDSRETTPNSGRSEFGVRSSLLCKVALLAARPSKSLTL